MSATQTTIKQQLVEALTIAKFRAWLDTFPSWTTPGMGNSQCNCPIANYIMCLKFPDVEFPAVKDSIFNVITKEAYLEHEEIPCWVFVFTHLVDELYDDKHIPAKRAIELLAIAQCLWNEVEIEEIGFLVQKSKSKGKIYWKCHLWQKGKEESTKIEMVFPEWQFPELAPSAKFVLYQIAQKSELAMLNFRDWCKIVGCDTSNTKALADYNHRRAVRKKFLKLMEIPE